MINLKTHKIGKTEKPFIIAEMSGNHNQSLIVHYQLLMQLQVRELMQLNCKPTRAQ